MTCGSKIVVVDLDETLGYFTELGMFWDALKSYIEYKHLVCSIDQELFDCVLNMFPEFLRPNIIDILTFIKQKKQKKHCYKLMIYTNNQGPTEWAKNIMSYFETKVGSPIFDQIIAAFKVQGKHIELCRTTQLKTHQDLIKCTQLPENTHICFLDDVFYPDMSNEYIYYINIKPYVYDLEFETLIMRTLKNPKLTSCLMLDNNLSIEEFKQFIHSFLNRYNYIYNPKSASAQRIDTILAKKILQHLHEFFSIKNKTRKRDPRGRNKTAKFRG